MSSKNKASVSLSEVAGRDRPVMTQQPAPVGRAARPRATARTKATDVARATPVQIGLYVHEATMSQARAAYLADFRSRRHDAPNGLDHWIGEAVRQLAALTPAQRDKRLAALPPEPATITDPDTGQERPAVRKGGKVRLSEDTTARMDIARAADEEAGITVAGRNTFIVAAMRFGTERARTLHQERTGAAELPPAPAGRLPRRGKTTI